MAIKACDDDMGALSDLFVAEAARPAHLTPALINELAPIARVLLVTDGTVTHMLRAHYREPVEVHVLAHTQQQLEQDDRHLELAKGEEILVRDVALVGAASGTVFCRARSLIVLKRMPAGMRDDIVSMRRSLGHVLLANFSENRRELLWHGTYNEPGDLFPETPNETVLERAYRVISNKQPLMIITEIFAPCILQP